MERAPRPHPLLSIAASVLALVLLTGCGGGGMISPGGQTLDARALLENPGDYDGRAVVVEGYLASGMEHSGFGPTMEVARGSWIWVSTAGAAMQGAPEEFWSGSATRVERVTITGTFHRGPGEEGRGFGHMGMFNHKLSADSISFHPRGESRLP